jgi:hypothetical protein
MARTTGGFSRLSVRIPAKRPKVRVTGMARRGMGLVTAAEVVVKTKVLMMTQDQRTTKVTDHTVPIRTIRSTIRHPMAMAIPACMTLCTPTTPQATDGDVVRMDLTIPLMANRWSTIGRMIIILIQVRSTRRFVTS